MSQGDGVKGPFFSDLEIDFVFLFDIKYTIRRYEKRRYIKDISYNNLVSQNDMMKGNYI